MSNVDYKPRDGTSEVRGVNSYPRLLDWHAIESTIQGLRDLLRLCGRAVA